LPPPVGNTTSASRPSSAQSIASRCIGRSASKPNHFCSTLRIAAVRWAASGRSMGFGSVGSAALTTRS
jgi:hypothetical protein